MTPFSAPTGEDFRKRRTHNRWRRKRSPGDAEGDSWTGVQAGGGVRDDTDHEINLSQAVKYFTLGGIKGSYVRHDVGTQEDLTKSNSGCLWPEKDRTKPGTFARK